MQWYEFFLNVKSEGLQIVRKVGPAPLLHALKHLHQATGKDDPITGVKAIQPPQDAPDAAEFLQEFFRDKTEALLAQLWPRGDLPTEYGGILLSQSDAGAKTKAA